MNIVLCILFGYLVGGINASYLIAKMKGFDIRTRGSGNAGASNAVIVMGKKIGIISALFDIFKAFFAYRFAIWLFPALSLAGPIAGTACIIGHIFPVFMRFRGGKGLACLGGVILAYDFRVFLALLVAELLLTLLLDYICVVPITASAVFPFIYGALSHDVRGALVFGIAGVVMLLKHIENLVRIHEGKEVHLSFLWKRDEEIDRVSHTPKD